MVVPNSYRSEEQLRSTRSEFPSRVVFRSCRLRGIEWSLRALASMRAVRLFLRARAVFKYVLRAASTLKNTDGEQRAPRKF